MKLKFNWIKTGLKSLLGLFTGVSAAAISNPEAITTIAGASNATKIGAIAAIIVGIANAWKHRK